MMSDGQELNSSDSQNYGTNDPIRRNDMKSISEIDCDEDIFKTPEKTVNAHKPVIDD